MSTNPALTSPNLSRFVRRWLDADPARYAELERLAGLSLASVDFAQLLEVELAVAPSLPAAMRRLRNSLIAAIAERDLDGRGDLDEVLSVISAFAEFVVNRHLADLYRSQCALHGVPTGEESGAPQQLIVVGMGKLGGYELNVSSDIDLIFLYPEDGETVVTAEGQRQLSNHEFFVRLGKKLIADIAEITADGFSFRVDMALRPNGTSGPLAASFGMLEEYLMVQGREWERYAWVKARALTGRAEDIAALEAIVRPFVYRRYLDFGSIHALRDMHAQIRAEVVRQETRHPERNINVKLGRGGIREIEFLAQVFQLIRGGRDPGLRDRSTRATLRILADKKLLPAEVTSRLLEAYTFLRNLEHRVQYLDDAQTHVLPASEDDRLMLARAMGYDDTPALLNALRTHADWVAARFDEMFDDKSSPEVGTSNDLQGLSFDEATEEVIAAHLKQLGFDDAPASAQRLLSSWRSNRIQSLPPQRKGQLETLLRASLPMMVKLADTASRSATLNRLLDFFDTIARRSAYLALLTEYPHTLARVIRMMAASDWAAKYLTRHPVLMDELLDDAILHTEPDWQLFAQECRQRLEAFNADTERQMDVLREQHHAQLFRLLAQDLDGVLSVERLADHLSALADVLISVTLEAVWHTLSGRHRDQPQFAVIAYGKLGGKELGYASDLDVIFLYDDEDTEAPAIYAKLAQRFITWMTSHTPAGILFDIDIALRPDGASGLLVSSLAAFEKYQHQSAWLWEHQALTRARFCAGDQNIGAHFEALRIQVLRQTRDPAQLRTEILAMRQRMHEAHPNRSEFFDLKHDAGGMIDIEFIVQFLVLRHAAEYPAMTGDIGNIALLKLAGDLKLIDPPLSVAVSDAYRLFRKLQHQIRLTGQDRARVELARVAEPRQAVEQLWQQVLLRD
jgi:[glutamine synthetase] adenylyltransferase / [glutamine synthetase]-adenylyl-L-tyrosine phosphorylase